MLSITKTTNLSGSSTIDNQTAMTMFASVQKTGSPTISQTITNRDLYLSNQSECDSDYDSFKIEVDKLLTEEQ